MAERQPIFPSVTPGTYALVEQVCQAQGCTQSDVVEGALLAYLAPRETSDRDTLLFQKLERLEQAVQSLVPLLEKITAYLAAQSTPPPPTVARYDQLYPELAAPAGDDDDTAVHEDPPPQPGGWRRLLTKKRTL